MASKTFEAAARRLFAPRLAELGFTRHGVRYYRPRPPWFLQGIELQQNNYNGSGFCRFTINLARTLVPSVTPERMIALAKARKSLFVEGNWIRLGHLTEVRQDYWYDYFPDDTAGIEAALNEALQDIQRFGMPWLRRGFGPLSVRRDPARAEAAKARFDQFVVNLKPGAGEEP